MDILRKELNQIYAAQHLDYETLDPAEVERARGVASVIAESDGGISVVTDASSDRCYIYSGDLGQIIGLDGDTVNGKPVDSSDEDEIYYRLHPEDLAEKRMLEYEFFKIVDSLDESEKKCIKATCRIRMRDNAGVYRVVYNTTQIIGLSPFGKIWLILCRYVLSPCENDRKGICPHIVNTATGTITRLSFNDKINNILTSREKQILRMISDGKPSKQIADALSISVYTVNRHRQNIISKLSVGNSIEAVSAAIAMKLL